MYVVCHWPSCKEMVSHKIPQKPIQNHRAFFYSRTNTVATTEVNCNDKSASGKKNLHPSLSSPDLWDYDEDYANSDYSSYHTSQVEHS